MVGQGGGPGPNAGCQVLRWGAGNHAVHPMPEPGGQNSGILHTSSYSGSLTCSYAMATDCETPFSLAAYRGTFPPLEISHTRWTIEFSL